MHFLGSLRSRLVGGLAVLLLLFLGLAVGAVTNLRTVNQAVAVELEVLSTGGYLTAALVGSVADQVRAGEGYLSSPSTALAVDFLRFGDSSHSYTRAYRRLAGLTPEDQSALNRMEANQAQMEVAYAQAHALRDLGQVEPASLAAASARQPADALIRDLRGLADRHHRRVAARIADLRTQAGDREQLVWLMLIAAIVIGAITALLTIRAVERPLRHLIAAARRFGEGDLRPMSLSAMPAELADLGQAMEAMGIRLRGIIDRLIREAGEVGTSARDLSAMSEELAAGSHVITQAIDGVTANADRQVREVQAADGVIGSWMAGTTRDQAAAERMSADGDRLGALAKHQAADLGQAVAALDAIRHAAAAAGTEVRAASRQVGVVNELLDLAHQLASQSEVLALNAAVEASRAGSHGDGMSAIASESRRLSETSRAAAARISDGITSLHERIGVVDQRVQSIAIRAAGAGDGAQRVLAVLDEIVRAAATIGERARQVTRAAEESRAIGTRVGELRASLEHDARQTAAASEAVTSAASEQAAATKDIATSAATLLEASERLAALVAEFRI